MKKQYFTEDWREDVTQGRLEKLAEMFGIKELDFNKENYIEAMEKIHEALTELRVDKAETKDWEEIEKVIF